MLILGFKPKRFAQWRETVRAEGRRLTWWGKLVLAWHMVRSALGLGRVKRKEWRRRMRVCAKCPVYDRVNKRCRPYPGSEAGCGCSVFLIALTEKHCWATENAPEEKWGW